jgi:hypothetical protein
VPRPHHLRTTSHRLLLAVTAGLLLAGCGGPAAETAATGPVTYDVPEVPVRVTAPEGWERVSRDGAFVLRAPAGAGSDAFRANVVVTGEPSDGPLQAAGSDTTVALGQVPGWIPSTDGQGMTTLTDLPAYRVAGTYETVDALVAQEILAVEAGTQAEPWTVVLTASHDADDAEGAAAVREILESIQVAPAG